MFESMDPMTLILMVCAGFFAGWVDAVVGGGGLVQLPALMLVPGLTPYQALAVNKLGSVFGTAASATTYYRRTSNDLKTSLPTAVVAFFASMGGAIVATHIPTTLFKPIIVCALVGVLLFTVFKPNLGELQQLKHTGARHILTALGIGVVIGFYDGLLGPGTGSFLMIALISLLGYNFLLATAQTKIINLATNLGALIFFALAGYQVWSLGLLLGAANLCGGYFGARTAIARGNKFIRVMMMGVVSALILTMAWELWGRALFF